MRHSPSTMRHSPSWFEAPYAAEMKLQLTEAPIFERHSLLEVTQRFERHATDDIEQVGLVRATSRRPSPSTGSPSGTWSESPQTPLRAPDAVFNRHVSSWQDLGAIHHAASWQELGTATFSPGRHALRHHFVRFSTPTRCAAKAPSRIASPDTGDAQAEDGQITAQAIAAAISAAPSTEVTPPTTSPTALLDSSQLQSASSRDLGEVAETDVKATETEGKDNPRTSEHPCDVAERKGSFPGALWVTPARIRIAKKLESMRLGGRADDWTFHRDPVVDVKGDMAEMLSHVFSEAEQCTSSTMRKARRAGG